MRYYTKDVVFQEVPNEISLSYSICGCPLNCDGCSWKSGLTVNSEEKELTDIEFEIDLKKYKGLVSCVLFLGGEWEKDSLLDKLNIALKYGYKTCLYTGLELENIDKNILSKLDYIKTGRYIKELGGLNNPNTNQKFIDLKRNTLLNNLFLRRI